MCESLDTVSLKNHIHENDKVSHILSELGCGNIRYNSKHDYYSASFPDGDNPQGINIKNNAYLNYRSFSRNVDYEDGKDVFDLVQYIRKCSFVDAVKYLHKILGIEYSPYKKQDKTEEKKIDPLAIFKRIRNRRKKTDVTEIQAIREEAINDFVPLTHINWFRDGIMPWTSKKFGLCYSYKYKRQCIPHRYWADGSLLGFNQRTTVDNYEELGIKKYYLTEGMNKSVNLYGLYENNNDIQEAGYVVVYESERSVLKRDSWLDSTGVALSGKTISEEQRRILIGLDVEIVLAFDKDVPVEEVWSFCEKFYHIRKISYIIDEDGLLGDKDSPADASNDDFNTLLNDRVEYNADKHMEYINSLEK